jgi:tetratricopeptide (TPR) repeat protein
LIFLIAAAVAAAAPAPAACPDVVTSEAFVCRALAASKSGQPETAALAFEQAAEAQSESEADKARAWAAAGNMWIAANQPGKAAMALDKALASPQLQAEQRGEALLDRARAAEAQNDLKTARTKVTEAAQNISDDPFLWYFSAALAIREGNAATAKSAIQRAMTMAPDDPTILFEAGHVFQFAGEPDQARTFWSRVDQLDPNGPMGKAAREAMTMLAAPPPAATPQPRS